MSAANEYARANPDVSSMDYLSGTATQINQPGFSEQELNSFAEDYATAQPGAAEYGLGQGGYETFNGAVNILLNELSAQGARRVKPGDK
jgi:methionine aminopeptidase